MASDSDFDSDPPEASLRFLSGLERSGAEGHLPSSPPFFCLDLSSSWSSRQMLWLGGWGATEEGREQSSSLQYSVLLGLHTRTVAHAGRLDAARRAAKQAGLIHPPRSAPHTHSHTDGGGKELDHRSDVCSRAGSPLPTLQPKEDEVPRSLCLSHGNFGARPPLT